MVFRVLSVLLFLLPSLVQAQFPRVELSAGVHRIGAEVAHTEPMRQQGLMYRKSMPKQQGMLFVFEQAAPYCMWMRNTFVPLSVAFLDARGTIINIADMTPQRDDAHCASAPAKYALEMNQGWFAQRKIGTGSKISGIDKAPPAR